MVDKNKTNIFDDMIPYLNDIKSEMTTIMDDNKCRKGELIFQTSSMNHDPDRLIELAAITTLYDTIDKCINDIDYVLDLYEMIETDSEINEHIDELIYKAKRGIKVYENFMFERQFCKKEDKLNAIVSIHSGSGGTEAEDWAGILSRMYCRWAVDNNYSIEIIYTLTSPEASAGIKKMEIIITGQYAYGKLKNENGVHRLIRKSPFDKALRRHTSFSSVKVTPEIDDTIVVDIDKADVRVDTMRGSGAGGQHRNVTDSAVRLTHLPTGVVAFSQGERSQHRNREIAWKTLYSRVYELEEEKRKKKLGEIIESVNAFGSQIRSYVLHPTQYVKDHRTGYTEYEFNKVIDGNLNHFIVELLK